MGLTTDAHDGCLHEIDPATGMQQCYLVLPDGARQHLQRPLRLTYVHQLCGVETRMHRTIAETYAAQPTFYGGTYCVGCHTHFRFDDTPAGTFLWAGTTERVGQ